MADPKVKRVLMSVTDKTGIVEFARALVQDFGAQIISTGGTGSRTRYRNDRYGCC